MQLFRIFNTSLARRKESRKRNLAFYLPHAVPMSPSVRLLENDDSFVTLQDIYEQQCISLGVAREEPLIQSSLKIRSVVARQGLERINLLNLKLELNEEIATKYVPKNTVAKYFTRCMLGPMELWLMRKQFTLQVAAISFMSYILMMGGRHPQKIAMSKSTGMIYSAELTPSIGAGQPMLIANEPVPFRFTPNMQEFMTDAGMEGLLTAGINAIARCLTEPEYDMEQQLGLFLREEILYWYSAHGKQAHADIIFRGHIQQNVDFVVRRAETLACKMERETTHKTSAIPATQAVQQAISQATNPQSLANMPEQWLPYL